VRLVYVDEAGISNPRQEPYLVVAGIIVHADKQWHALEQYLRDMVTDFIPPWLRTDFTFHAHQLFAGGGKVFDRQVWPKEIRWRILQELVSIPEKFDLPVVCGFVDRAKFETAFGNRTPHDVTVGAHTAAFSMCAVAANEYMNKRGEAGEVALLIAENNDNARRLIRTHHNFIRDPAKVVLLSEETRKNLPLTRLVDTVHFAEKLDSILLQLADACAYAIKRRLMKASDSDRFYQPLVPFMVRRPNLEALDRAP
jgi:hypothetical protein